MDIKIPKPDSARRLEATDDFDELVPRHLHNPNQYLIEIDGKRMECTVTHEPLPEEADRRLVAPRDSHVYPANNAVLGLEYIDFVVDVTDRDNDLRRILFFLKTVSTGRTRKTKFSPNLGSGRYTFHIGPFTDGEYQWAVQAIDKTKKKSRKNFDSFTVKLPVATLPPSPPPPTTAQVTFEYYAPASETEDPVTFEWSVNGNGLSLIYLFVTFPDNSQGYLTRNPTPTGRDTVSVSLNESGNYEWSLAADLTNGNSDKGPRDTFAVRGPPPNPVCGEGIG